MTEVVSVKFKNRGKNYYFSPGELSVPDGADVVVETSKGLELAQCVKGNHPVPDECVVQPLRPIVRVATEADLRVAEINRKREQEAFGIAAQKILDHGLDMKLVDVECSFEGNKTTFFFTSDGRVDFRELVKDLAGVFRNRIELRQIGVRDEAKMLGGLGICGRPFCCSAFLDDFQPVSTKMAKIQSMSLNPTKISGSCGRLMCCLRYEEEAYEDLTRTVPKQGSYVETPAGYGSVCQVNLLRRTVKVRLDGEGEEVVKAYIADEVAVVPGGRPKPGEKPPELLKYRPKPVREEPEEPDEPDFWKAPSRLTVDPTPVQSAEAPEGGDEQEKKKPQSHRRGRGNRGRSPVKPDGRNPAKPEGRNPAKPEGKNAVKPEGRPTQEPRPAGRPAPHSPAKAADEAKQQKSGGVNRSKRRRGGRPHPPQSEGGAKE